MSGTARIGAEEIGEVFRRARRRGLVSDRTTAVVFHDLTRVAGRLATLRRLFPPGTLHAVAVKANPLPALLRRLRSPGVGLEVASLPELRLALAAGFSPETIVFDSPAKTREEIAEALGRGVHLNADSLAELDRIARDPARRTSRSLVGVRVNPQVGTGRIAATGVAGEYSKFGIPLREQRAALLDALDRFPWLRALHVHVGSQGCPLEMLARGTADVVALAEEANERWRAGGAERRIEAIDIGGGMPVQYADRAGAPSMREYRSMLGASAAPLFSGRYRVITEFGRWVQANAGWVAARVEYVKVSAGHTTAVVHVGADLFLRTCYDPEHWAHEFFVLDPAGRPRGGPRRRTVVGGPLCFAGDIIGRDRLLPEVAEGDYLVVRDAGAYTLAMWSRYNSRAVPAVLGYWKRGTSFEVLRREETPEDVVAWWSGGRLSPRRAAPAPGRSPRGRSRG